MRRAVVAAGAVLTATWWPATRTFAADATPPPRTGPSPSATTPAAGLGSSGHGTGFVVLAVIIVAALLFSTWRLRRDR